MAAFQYECKSCGQTHVAPTRPGGALYLRCVATREWAWYEPSSFLAPAGLRTESLPARAARPARRAVRTRARRTSAAGRRRAPARASHRAAPRKRARPSRRRR